MSRKQGAPNNVFLKRVNLYIFLFVCVSLAFGASVDQEHCWGRCYKSGPRGFINLGNLEFNPVLPPTE